MVGLVDQVIEALNQYVGIELEVDPSHPPFEDEAKSLAVLRSKSSGKHFSYHLPNARRQVAVEHACVDLIRDACIPLGFTTHHLSPGIPGLPYDGSVSNGVETLYFDGKNPFNSTASVTIAKNEALQRVGRQYSVQENGVWVARKHDPINVLLVLLQSVTPTRVRFVGAVWTFGQPWIAGKDETEYAWPNNLQFATRRG